MNNMTTQLTRLNKCVDRLADEFAWNAPSIIKKLELSYIKSICDNLLIILEKGDLK